MIPFVLIHGAWHGAWCWEKLTPILEAAGHRVLAPDLPGHGDDRTPLAAVTLDLYANRLCELLDTLSEPAILVGHSMGGIVISQAAERRPSRVRTLAYVSGFLLRDGQSLLDVAGADTESLLLPNLEWAADGRSARVAPAAVREAFYAECSELDAIASAARLTAQPTAPTTTPVHVTEPRFGSIPRVYVECRHDRAVSPGSQRAMYTATPCVRVASLATDHSPFYSAPERLAGVLLSLTK